MATRWLILVGNTGVGKSFIGNALLGSEAFSSAQQADSLTSSVMRAQMTDEQGCTWQVVDVPGLQEADTNNLRCNAQAAQEAFAMAQGAPVVVAFVVTLEGGRLGREHSETIGALLDNCKGLTSDNVLLIINKVRDDEPEHGALRLLGGRFPTIKHSVVAPYIPPTCRRDLLSTAVRDGVPKRVFPVLQRCVASDVQANSVRLRSQVLDDERQRILEAGQQHEQQLAQERAAEDERRQWQLQQEREQFEAEERLRNEEHRLAMMRERFENKRMNFDGYRN